MVSKLTMSRLKKELKLMHDEPPELILARPDEKNMLIWHYLLQGPPGTDFAGGWYWGRLKFPKNYPMGPPTITMATPNGRFEINKRLCLSMSDFHPETWEPSWTISTVLTGLLSFMVEETRTAGSIETTSSVKKKHAKESAQWNLDNDEFMSIYSEFEEIMAQASSGGGSSSSRAKPDDAEKKDGLIRPGILDTADKEAKAVAEFHDAVSEGEESAKSENPLPEVEKAARPSPHVLPQTEFVPLPNKTEVIIKGLRSKPYFNGMRGTVFGIIRNRHKIRVNGTALALSHQNFTVVA